VGIKSREIYEAPGATVILSAHRELEALVLDRETQHFKEIVSLRYAELAYYGLWYSELKKALDAFIDSTQKYVCGSIRMKLLPGMCAVAGRQSPHSLYKKELATYGKEDTFDQKLAEGFIRLWGMPYKR
jgi:argininosuccinate synthase